MSVYPDVYEAGSTTALLRQRLGERGSQLSVPDIDGWPDLMVSRLIESNRTLEILLAGFAVDQRLFTVLLDTVDPPALNGILHTQDFSHIVDVSRFWLEFRWSMVEIQDYFESIPNIIVGDRTPNNCRTDEAIPKLVERTLNLAKSRLKY